MTPDTNTFFMATDNPVKVTRARGGVGMVFTATSYAPIDAEMAQKLQALCGFMPMGYGFYAFKTQDIAPHGFEARWQCSASCD